MKSRLKTLFDSISDKNLYGRSFFLRSFPYLIFGLIIQYYVHYLLNPQLLIIYVPFYVGLVLFSALFTKNFRMEFHPMPLWLAYLLLFTSAFSKAFAYFAPFKNVFVFFPPLAQHFLVLMISEAAFLASLITIVVLGQRISIRDSVGLTDNYFANQKNRWKSKVKGFPNFDKILANLDGGRFVASLFDKGLFNLTILWSCNVMEEVIDAITDGIIGKAPEKRDLFKTKEGRSKRCPLQLENLGYKSVIKHPKKKGFHANILWHKIRNDIAHRNYRPTFKETNETLKILVLFVRETPTILQKWGSAQKFESTRG